MLATAGSRSVAPGLPARAVRPREQLVPGPDGGPLPVHPQRGRAEVVRSAGLGHSSRATSGSERAPPAQAQRRGRRVAEAATGRLRPGPGRPDGRAGGRVLAGERPPQSSSSTAWPAASLTVISWRQEACWSVHASMTNSCGPGRFGRRPGSVVAQRPHGGRLTTRYRRRPRHRTRAARMSCPSRKTSAVMGVARPTTALAGYPLGVDGRIPSMTMRSVTFYWSPQVGSKRLPVLVPPGSIRQARP